jgi:hypothetical protein
MNNQVHSTAYRVVATNSSAASENRIHSDAEAARWGFRGGLVPGVTLYGYACHVLLETLGSEWVECGSTRVRFVAPCYHAEEVVVGTQAGPGDVLSFSVKSGERTCVVGSAVLVDRDVGGVGQMPIPVPAAPVPEDRPTASDTALAVGTVLGSVRLPTDVASADAYLTKVGELSSAYAVQDILHPGVLLEGANQVLMANVVLPAWLHVESDIRHRRAVAVGEPVDVRARVADRFARKGHQFVGLDVSWVAGDETVATARHVAIWQLAGPS